MEVILGYALTALKWLAIISVACSTAFVLIFVVPPMIRYWIYHRPVERWAEKMASKGSDAMAQRTLEIHAALVVAERVARKEDAGTKLAVYKVLDERLVERRDLDNLDLLYLELTTEAFVPRAVRDISAAVKSYRSFRKPRHRFSVVGSR